jgi:hypothetical protein
MNQAARINLFVTCYATALFIFFQPIVFPFSLDYISINGDSYYGSLLLRFGLFFIVGFITFPVVYYLVDHFPHHPDP